MFNDLANMHNTCFPFDDSFNKDLGFASKSLRLTESNVLVMPRRQCLVTRFECSS